MYTGEDVKKILFLNSILLLYAGYNYSLAIDTMELNVSSVFKNNDGNWCVKYRNGNLKECTSFSKAAKGIIADLCENERYQHAMLDFEYGYHFDEEEFRGL